MLKYTAAQVTFFKLKLFLVPCCCVFSYHSSAVWGFLSRAFSRIALALVSCPTLSSKCDSNNHSGTEWGHFFNCTNENKNP